MADIYKISIAIGNTVLNPGDIAQAAAVDLAGNFSATLRAIQPAVLGMRIPAPLPYHIAAYPAIAKHIGVTDLMQLARQLPHIVGLVVLSPPFTNESQI